MKWTTLASLTGVWLGLGCGAAGDDGQGVEVRPNTGGPSNSGGSGGSLPSVDPATPASGATGPDFNVGDEPSEAAPGCQQAERTFVPNTPTVYMLVDRSGTMFDPIVDNVSAWSALRGGVLDVMRELEGSVRFGFAAFSGANGGVVGGVQQCQLDVPSVVPQLNNYSAISQLYQPLEKPTNTSNKETPTVLALQEVATQLNAVTDPGDKYIVFVTDGEPDYCNDSNALCPPDSVVGLLQNLAAGIGPGGVAQVPIHTLVFGISSPTASVRQDVLQAFANAGAGLPVEMASSNPNQAPDPNSIYDQCAQEPGWAVDFAATGKPAARGQTIGTYVLDPTGAGAAPVYRPDPTDQAALTDQIRAALAGVKSCTFDLGEDGVEVDLTRQDLGQLAHVLVNGAPVVFDAVNGWSMANPTTVTLAGAACDAWRAPTVATSISFDFPCDIFVPR
jgi:hypothetical protein